MPLYTVTAQAGVLSDEAKRDLAAKLTKLHSEYAGVPPNWVHIIFHDYGAGSGFTAGKPSAPAALTLLIRTGRSADYKRELIKRLWGLSPGHGDGAGHAGRRKLIAFTHGERRHTAPPPIGGYVESAARGDASDHVE